MKKWLTVLGLGLLLGLSGADGKPLVLFGSGKLSCKLKTPGRVENGKLIFSTTDATKLIIESPTQDLRPYDTLRVVFEPSRTGDQYRFTMTANPPGATDWNYYFGNIGTIDQMGKQTLSVDLTRLGRSRNPLGMDHIQSIEFNFIGWEMKWKKGLILKIDEIVLLSDPQKTVTRRREAEEISAAGKTAELLPKTPWIAVPNCDDRSFWESLRDTDFARSTLRHAEDALALKVVPPPEEYYLDFVRNGIRVRYEKSYVPLIQGFENLTLAICLTGDTAKYLPKWKEFAEVLCRKMPTWVYPAHDKDLHNLHRTRVSIDLVSSRVAASVSTAALLLKPVLSADWTVTMTSEVKRQVVTPFLLSAAGRRSPDWFVAGVNNWNAVCLANVTITILATQLDPAEKRLALAYALVNSKNYLRGFPEDGYCSEGISYWTYGYGHYLLLAATVYEATGGKVNLLDSPAARIPAVFPEKFMLSEQHFPAFSDSYFNAGISPALFFLRDYLLKRDTSYTRSSRGIATSFQSQLAILGLPGRLSASAPEFRPEIVSEFPNSGVFVVRGTRPDSLCLAFKGGSNHELHNHNDVGSYGIAYPRQVALLGDAGGAVYTRDSFNEKRYNNRILNSYGHPVPVPAGTLQSAGTGTDARILFNKRTPESYSVGIDLKPAYPKAQTLLRLERVFHYSWNTSRIEITDTAEFTAPESFECPLISFGQIRKCPDGSLEATYAGGTVSIKINAGEIPWQLKEEVLEEEINWKDKVRRYAVVLEGKHRKVTLQTVIMPLNRK